MKTYVFYKWVVVEGNRVYKEFTFTAESWTRARRMLSEELKKYQ